MSDVAKTRVLGAEITFHRQPLRSPLVLSTGAIHDLVEARAAVRVCVGDAREATGYGSIYLSDLWAWPDPAVPHEQREAALIRLCERIAERLADFTGREPAHPLEFGLRLHDAVCHEPPHARDQAPVLARAMCLSPFDAAVHDAAGRALGCSAFDLYAAPVEMPSADGMFAGGAGGAIRRTLLDAPRTELPAWLIVGKGDDLERDVRPWADERGYRCFKLKVMGKDNAADVERTVEVYRRAAEWRIKDPWLSIDSNEGNANADGVLDFLLRLRAADPAAFAAVKYLEQPTGRDIRASRYDWRGVTALKPVLLDEGLTDLALLEDARLQGWSGLALKTCKGHSFALVAAAWAREQGMLLSLQDLTNPGFAMLHAGLLAAYLPTINGVELNSPQFTPAANAGWSARLPAFFEPTDGIHRLPQLPLVGLGSAVLEPNDARGCAGDEAWCG